MRQGPFTVSHVGSSYHERARYRRPQENHVPPWDASRHLEELNEQEGSSRTHFGRGLWYPSQAYTLILCIARTFSTVAPPVVRRSTLMHFNRRP